MMTIVEKIVDYLKRTDLTLKHEVAKSEKWSTHTKEVWSQIKKNTMYYSWMSWQMIALVDHGRAYYAEKEATREIKKIELVNVIRNGQRAKAVKVVENNDYECGDRVIATDIVQEKIVEVQEVIDPAIERNIAGINGCIEKIVKMIVVGGVNISATIAIIMFKNDIKEWKEKEKQTSANIYKTKEVLKAKATTQESEISVKNGHHLSIIGAEEDLPDFTQGESDVPQVQAFVDMGLADKIEPNRFKMVQRIAEESCTVSYRSGQPRLLTFHMKAAADYQKPYHLRPENIQKWLGEDVCDWLDANTLSVAWGKLGFNSSTVHKLIFGYLANDGKWRCGLKAAKKSMAEYFENMANEFDGTDSVSLNTYRNEGYELTDQAYSSRLIAAKEAGNDQLVSTLVIEQAAMIEKYAEAKWQEHLVEKDNLIEYATGFNDENFTDTREFVAHVVRDTELGDPADHTDLEFEDPEFHIGPTGGDAVWGAHLLYDGSESLPHEVITLIRFATFDELLQIKSAMFDQKNERTERTYRKKLWMLTDPQVSQAWTYIKAREEQIFENAYAKCGQQVLETIEELKNTNKKLMPQLARKIWAMINGGRFSDFGVETVFTPIKPYEAHCLRLAYNAVKKGM